VVECKGIIDDVAIGDEIDINLRKGILKNITTGREFSFVPLSDFAFKIAEAGGLLQAIKRK
jgi:3-isopropylmalate/(R)-2-methylmalate dehydratase small subunit